jgi:predicted small lipoprotein YifL
MIHKKTFSYHIASAVAAAAILLSVAACGNKGDAAKKQPEAAVVDTVPQLVMQIQQCSRLYTTEVKVHKIVTHDDVVRLKGKLMNQSFSIPLPLGDRKIAIPMDATLKAYIDFSEFDERSIERDGDRITILLPDPQVVLTSSKINQKDIREYVGLVRSHFTDSELSHYEQQGRQAIIDGIPDLHIIETAQANAARVLVPMAVQMGYREENVTIAFRRNLSINDIIKRTIEK